MKWFLRVLGLLAVLALLVLGGGYLWLRQSLPDYEGEVALKGLKAPVRIVTDRYGVAHIYAKNETDGVFAMGYAHAQNRLWQMEMNRRVGAGRLSEVFGPQTLGKDKFLRTIGFYQAARRTYAKLDQNTKKLLQAYADGVNAFLENNTKPLPPEFLVFGITPEPWKPEDSVVWLKMMAWDLGGNWSKELLRARMSKRLSARQIAEAFPPYPGDKQITPPTLAGLYRTLDLDRLAAAMPAPAPDGLGSNNWVVSGKRTASGKPLLANDPHLGLAAPALWFFAEIDTGDYTAIGATLPGVPTIILGRNENIAWGFTNTAPDVQDLYYEKIDPQNPGRYLTPDGSAPFRLRREVIKVKGGEDVVLNVRETRHGPVISDIYSPAASLMPEKTVLSFAWTALRDDDKTPQAGFKLQKARGWEDFLAAMRDFHVPQQNVVYADRKGNIGYIAAGKVPIRKPGNKIMGMMPVPGWQAEYDWNGFIPFEELPRNFNPASGVLITANHKIIGDDYPYFITYEWTPPYRARRIRDLLNARDIHTIDSFKAIQADVKSYWATDILPLVTAIEPKKTRSRLALEKLRAWDGVERKNGPEGLIFNAWMRHFGRLMYGDEMGSLLQDYWATRPVFVENVLRDVNGQSRWCDDVGTPEKEDCATILSAALDAAIRELDERYGDNMDDWNWGRAHEAHSDHTPFTNVPVLRDIFDLRVPVGGDTYTINVSRNKLTDESQPYATIHAASLRAIYDLEDPNRSVFIHSTGQSGNRLSPLYDSFVDIWARGEYIPMSTNKEDNLAGALGVLELKPR